MSDLGTKLIETVRQKAAENPHFIYTPPDGDQCVYVHEGKPSCIVGHALWAEELIGPELEKDTSRVGHYGDVPNGTTAPILLEYLNLTLNGGEVEWLNMVQSHQDNDVPWGRAVATADRNFLAAAV
jgi:hypothetical protein